MVELELRTGNPTELATAGSEPDGSGMCQLIHLWELDLDVLLGDEGSRKPARRSIHYRNAKVVLVGDTGVGKSGLALRLNGRPYEETDSTAGRHVWTLDEVRWPSDAAGDDS